MNFIYVNFFFYVEQVMNGMSRKLVRRYIKIEHPLQNEKKKRGFFLSKQIDCRCVALGLRSHPSTTVVLFELSWWCA